MKNLIAHEESTDSEDAVLQLGTTHLESEISEFYQNHVLNLENDGYFYKLALGNTEAVDRPAGRKKMKDDVNNFDQANYDGSEKSHTMCIGIVSKF